MRILKRERDGEGYRAKNNEFSIFLRFLTHNKI